MTYPHINPEILRIGPLAIRWYGLLYIISFVITYLFLKKKYAERKILLNGEDYENLIFYIMLGVILGGRIGYILFYNLGFYFKNPLEIFAVWHGGMSFHGGALGVMIAGLIFARKVKIGFYRLADPVMSFVAIGLGLGRIGNFINGELYGRVTSLPWGMIFPNSDGLPRHPSQLYEFFLEGICLFFISRFVLKKQNHDGITFWSFIGFYGIFRFMLEFVRQPDPQLGFVIGIFTQGQILSSFMILASIIGIIFISKTKDVQSK